MPCVTYVPAHYLEILVSPLKSPSTAFCSPALPTPWALRIRSRAGASLPLPRAPLPALRQQPAGTRGKHKRLPQLASPVACGNH